MLTLHIRASGVRSGTKAAKKLSIEICQNRSKLDAALQKYVTSISAQEQPIISNSGDNPQSNKNTVVEPLYQNLNIVQINQENICSIDCKVEDVRTVINSVSKIPLVQIVGENSIQESFQRPSKIKPVKSDFLSAEWKLAPQFQSKRLLCKVSLDLDNEQFLAKLKSFGDLESCFAITNEFHELFVTKPMNRNYEGRNSRRSSKDESLPGKITESEVKTMTAQVQAIDLNNEASSGNEQTNSNLSTTVLAKKSVPDTILIAVTYAKINDAINAQRTLSELYYIDKNYVSCVYLAFNADILVKPEKVQEKYTSNSSSNYNNKSSINDNNPDKVQNNNGKYINNNSRSSNNYRENRSSRQNGNYRSPPYRNGNGSYRRLSDTDDHHDGRENRDRRDYYNDNRDNRYRQYERKTITSYINATNEKNQKRLSDKDFVDKFPLRILVPAASVGAIIGQKGKNIKLLTQESKCKSVNIDTQTYNGSNYYKHKDDKKNSTTSTAEKLIWIHGDPQSTSYLCRKILQIVSAEYQEHRFSGENTDQNGDEGEGHHQESLKIPLKILADDRYVGRLIGKDGHVLKSMQEESEATIAISSSSEVAQWNGDRQITIYGTLDQIIRGEGLVSNKLRRVFDHDMGKPESMCHRSSYGPHVYTREKRNLRVYIPEGAVGNVIGKAGDSIRNIMSSTFTKIRIFPERIPGSDLGINEIKSKQLQNLPLYRFDSNSDQFQDHVNPETILFRKVSIQADIGDDNAMPSAQHAMIDIVYEKNTRLDKVLQIRIEKGQNNAPDNDSWTAVTSQYELEYLSEMIVPQEVIGRIVGKQGKSIKELQRSLRVKLLIPPPDAAPEMSDYDQNVRNRDNSGDSAHTSPKSSASDDSNHESKTGASIKVFGMMTNVIRAQKILYQIVDDFMKEKYPQPRITRNFNQKKL